MSFFRVIIPNYNNAKWLNRCIGSVIDQTFQDFGMVFIDDCSTDGSIDVARAAVQDFYNAVLISNETKRYNGGSRNVGLGYYREAEYTLFLDSDDWFHDNKVFQDLHDFIVGYDYPDCIRLPYNAEYDGNKSVNVMLDDDTIAKLVRSNFCACWSKCVRSELIPPFPENTLMEDAVQHIKQCDLIHSLGVFTGRPVYTHNRNNGNSCSIEKNHDLQNSKWKSSMYRYMADLLDLELEHGYCEAERKRRSEKCLADIKKGLYIQ